MALSRKLKTLQKSPAKSRGIAWRDKDVEELIELMKEETIMFSLENARMPKEKRAVYKSVQVQLENKGLPDEGADLESETDDDGKIGSDDEVASVHDEEQSNDTNDMKAEGCSELAKRKLELEEEELKPYVKKSNVSKKERKTKLEKSMAVLSDSFKDAAEREMDMLMKLEQMRHKDMFEHEMRLKELDNERRIEERQHELMLLNF
ncbi:transcription initiation factor TFIID subunit 7-like [Montipora capricornis]|uniref:transcription initiation factor TFIID subunit 7-like n=1 Tax=Montipora capricornis TaxID=246305 RepID=UPI0035F182FC